MKYTEDDADTGDAGTSGKIDKAVNMSKRVIKSLVLAAVFLAALIIFSILTNQVNKDLTTNMSDASLPVMHFYMDDTKVNELHGYTQEMDALKMRDTITPVGTSRKLAICIDTYGKAIDEIAYEIRSMDGDRLVAEKQLSDYQSNGNKISADVVLENILQKDEEYLLIFTLTSGSDNMYYYTRVMETDDCYTDECLQFAMKFHNSTFDGSGESFIPTYIEAATGDATTFNYVDLTCTLKQIMWADFKPTVLTEPVVDFKEINSSYNVLTVDYVMTYVNEYGETEYYNVEEYYRLRQTAERMYVLNFERTTEEIFNVEKNFFADTDEIQLGIRDQNVEYETNENGNLICFVQSGDLWCYDATNNEISRIFSFRGNEGIDARENWNQHDIRIVRVDEAGSVDFVVYGYMNRGDHEGEVGAAVYHYDGLAYTIEEEAFIPSDASYEILKAEMGQLIYQDDVGMFYLMQEGNIYKINLSDFSVKKMVEDLDSDCYAVAASNKYVSWVESDNKYSCTEVNILNLKDGDSFTITADSGNYIRPLGFIGEDFIYGIANSSDVITDQAGNVTFPMNTLKIIDVGNESELKTYSPSSGYIQSISIEDYTIQISLFGLGPDGQYVAAGSDSIMNREADSNKNVSVKTSAMEIKETQVQLQFNAARASSKLKKVASKGVLIEEDRTVNLEQTSGERFYVYVKGNVELATDSISDAINLANNRLGVVIDSKQNYIWMRARKNSQSAFQGISCSEGDAGAGSVVGALSAMLEYNGITVSVSELVQAGNSARNVLESTMEDAIVLDISGVGSEELLFYLSNGTPVFAMTGSNSAILVTGYSSNETLYYYDPSTNTNGSMSFEDADILFTKGGNKFITYIK